MARGLLFAGLLLAGAVVATSASAADLSPAQTYKAAAAMPGFNWTGWYAGIGGGYQAGTVTGTAVVGFDVEPRVWYLGVQGGYRVQLPDNLVLGLDLSAPIWMSSNTFTPVGAGGAAKVDPLFALFPEVQLGYAIGRWMPFAGFGVGFADIKATGMPTGAATVSDTEIDPLYIFSIGVNYAWTDQVIVGVRYDHIDLDEHNYTFATVPTPTVEQVGANSDGVSAFIEYKF